MQNPPQLLTYDIFGTVLDWKKGLTEALRKVDFNLSDEAFDRVIDEQAKEESKEYQTYQKIVALSLEKIGVTKGADLIGRRVGEWPLFPDSKEALREIMKTAPCVAMSNSDFLHSVQVQRQLGYKMSDWISAEQVRAYKPNPIFWEFTAKKRQISFDKNWWHISAYADYDLEVAKKLGLTTVFIERPHSRRGEADYSFSDLASFAKFLKEQIKE